MSTFITSIQFEHILNQVKFDGISVIFSYADEVILYYNHNHKKQCLTMT